MDIRLNEIRNFFNRISFNIVTFVLGFLLFFPYYDFVSGFVPKIIGDTFWGTFAILSFYHYLILLFVSFIISHTIDALNKKPYGISRGKSKCDEGNKIAVLFIEWVSFCNLYAKKGLIYSALKNKSYLLFLLIYKEAMMETIMSCGKSENGEGVALVISILFLIDTFINQEEAINDKANEKNGPTKSSTESEPPRSKNTRHNKPKR